MIYNFLQRNSPYIIFVFPFFMGLFWMDLFIKNNVHSEYYDTNPMPLYALYLKLLSFGKIASIGGVLFWVSVNSFILTRLNSIHRLIEKGTSIYIFIYVILSAALLHFKEFNPLQPALCFILLGILSIFKMYKNERGLKPVFEAGMFFSIAALFYANSIFISLFIFVSLFSLVPINWRQWLGAILGLATPLFVVLSIYFLTDSLLPQIQIIKQNTVVWHSSFEIEKTDFIFLFVLGILFIASIFKHITVLLKKVSSKKYYSLLLYLDLLIALIYFLVPSAGLEIFFFSIITFVFYLSNYLINLRSQRMQEMLFIILILSALAVQYI